MDTRGNTDRFVGHAGARLRWRLEGLPDATPALVLIHGWALSLEYWDPVARLLSPACRLLRYDRRGFGVTQGPYDPGLACDDLIALLDAADLDRVCLVGMSQGARVAIHAAIRAPRRVSGIVLDGAPWFEAETELPLAEYRRLRDGQGLAAMQGAILSHPLMQLAQPDPQRQSLLEACVSSYRGVDLDGGWAPVPPPDLGAILQPTLVMHGSLDGDQRRDAALRLREAIAGAKLVEIARSAHLAALDQPEEWTQAVLRFAAEQ